MAPQRKQQVGRLLAKAKKRDAQQKQDSPYIHRHVSDGLQSVTERKDIEDFLDQAKMAQRDFTAVRGEIVVVGSLANTIPTNYAEPLLEYENVPIPRRPQWDASTTPEELDQSERDMFLGWRRNLADIEGAQPGKFMTPFEKNLDVWRQLWRVVERSDVVVQIVDGRNPLLFYSQDLVNYIDETGDNKKSLLVINKSDLLSPHMREHWADYFSSRGIPFAFCSAIEELDRQTNMEELAYSKSAGDNNVSLKSTNDLFAWFRSTMFGSGEDDGSQITVGMVGYPNVGKSSLVNALCGAKKVGVASMPGKTRHFQTIIMGDITLCDCPGLVFPTLMNSKAALVCNGILPIDRIKDHTSPAGWICNRVNRDQLETVCKVKLPSKPTIQATDLLQAYALRRGFMTTSGRPDEARGARYILKMFVNGQLLYCQPPPHLTVEEKEAFFNSLERTSIIYREPPSSDTEAADILLTEVAPAAPQKPAKLSRTERARMKAHAKNASKSDPMKDARKGNAYKGTVSIQGYLNE